MVPPGILRFLSVSELYRECTRHRSEEHMWLVGPHHGPHPHGGNYKLITERLYFITCYAMTATTMLYGLVVEYSSQYHTWSWIELEGLYRNS
jgi:hypothetical protein